VPTKASQQRPPTPLFVFILAFAIIGVVLSVGLYTGAQSILASADTEGTQGTVVELERRSNGRKAAYVPVVEYRVAGRLHRFTGSVASAPPMHAVGEQVQVLYKVDEPETAFIDSFSDRWLGPLVFTVVGSFFLAALVWAKIRQRG